MVMDTQQQSHSLMNKKPLLLVLENAIDYLCRNCQVKTKCGGLSAMEIRQASITPCSER